MLKTERIVPRCSNPIRFMLFHRASLITSCWPLLSTERCKLVMQTDRPHQSVSCTSWWCVWADVCNVAVLWRSPEISRTSGKRQLIWTDQTGGDIIYLFPRNISNTRLFSTCFPSQISPRIQRGIVLIYHFFNLEAKYPWVHRRYYTVWASRWIVQMNHSKALTHSGAKHMTAFISESLND